MLILFDLDMTLISTGGAGMAALTFAARSLHGAHVHAEGVAYAGRLDPLIVADLLRVNGIEPTPAHIADLRTAYARALPEFLARERCRTLAGVPELLAAVRDIDAPALGLLTGNFPESGRHKLRACGIDEQIFAVRVWGDQSELGCPGMPPAREHLVRVGMDRAAALRGRALEAQRVTVVGDTPHDVACAKAHGARAVAVATGQFDEGSLARAGADVVLRDFSDTARALAALGVEGVRPV